MTTQLQDDGKEYPECLSLPLDKFTLKDPLEQVLIKQENFYRPDLFFSDMRGTNNLEDVILWLNDVSSRRELFPGTQLNLPSNDDVTAFYIRYRR